MTTKTKIIISAISLLVAFGFGRFSAPTKVIKEVETKIVEVKVEDTKTDTSRNRRVEKIITETTRPDGTKVVETRIVDASQTERSTEKETATNRTESSRNLEVVERDSGSTSISVLAALGKDSSFTTPIYGAHAQRRILGPISVGVFGLTTGVVGASLGLQF